MTAQKAGAQGAVVMGVTTVRLPPEISTEVSRIAALHRVSRGYVIRECVRSQLGLDEALAGAAPQPALGPGAAAPEPE